MRQRLAVPEEDVLTLCLKGYKTFGTTYAGLLADGYVIDADEWHAHVHGSLDYERYFPQPDAALRQLLLSLPQQGRLWIFTNADDKHAAKCLELLGIADVFGERVITFESLQSVAKTKGLPLLCKPSLHSFHAALELAGAEPATTCFLDDSIRNVEGALNAQISAVLVGSTSRVDGALAEVAHIHRLRCAVPSLWGDIGSSSEDVASLAPQDEAPAEEMPQ